MVRVTTEIGRLRKVLVHEPGPEVDRMVPPMMEELLFDDILFGDRARDEHRRFRRLLQLLGIDVVEANTLLAEALASEEARSWLWARLRPEAPQELRAGEPPPSAEEAVAIATTGILASEGCRGIEVEDLFRLPPLPNWCFQRDPQVILGDGVIFSAMATAARWREGLLSRCIFRFHPEFAGTPVVVDPLREAQEAGQFFGPHRPRLEFRREPIRSPWSCSPKRWPNAKRAPAGSKSSTSRPAERTCTSTRSSRSSIETPRWFLNRLSVATGHSLQIPMRSISNHQISSRATGDACWMRSTVAVSICVRSHAAAATRWHSNASSGPTAPTPLLSLRASSCSMTVTLSPRTRSPVRVFVCCLLRTCSSVVRN